MDRNRKSSGETNKFLGTVFHKLLTPVETTIPDSILLLEGYADIALLNLLQLPQRHIIFLLDISDSCINDSSFNLAWVQDIINAVIKEINLSTDKCSVYLCGHDRPILDQVPATTFLNIDKIASPFLPKMQQRGTWLKPSWKCLQKQLSPDTLSKTEETVFLLFITDGEIWDMEEVENTFPNPEDFSNLHVGIAWVGNLPNRREFWPGARYWSLDDQSGQREEILKFLYSKDQCSIKKREITLKIQPYQPSFLINYLEPDNPHKINSDYLLSPILVKPNDIGILFRLAIVQTKLEEVDVDCRLTIRYEDDASETFNLPIENLTIKNIHQPMLEYIRDKYCLKWRNDLIALIEKIQYNQFEESMEIECPKCKTPYQKFPIGSSLCESCQEQILLSEKELTRSDPPLVGIKAFLLPISSYNPHSSPEATASVSLTTLEHEGEFSIILNNTGEWEIIPVSSSRIKVNNKLLTGVDSINCYDIIESNKSNRRFLFIDITC